MDNRQKKLAQQIEQFESHYDYDGGYMRDLLASSPAGYEKFDAVMPLVQHRELLDVDTYWVARLAAMKVGDCGDCLQLVVKMALESGISKTIVNAVLHSPDRLPKALQEVYVLATVVAENKMDDTMAKKIESRFNTGQRIELGLCIATTLFFPIIRRAGGYANQCRILDIAV